MNKNKEILELKKLYLLQIEKWESRFYFAILAFSVSLILLSLNGMISYWWGIGLYLITTVILQNVFESWRTKKFNDLKREIETGKFKDMKIMPMKFYKKIIANYRNAQLVRTYANDDLRGELRMKRIKQDKQFMIQFDQVNRDFLSNTATFMLAFAISLTSLLISVVAIIIAINGINIYSIIVTIILGIVMFVASVWFSIKVKRILQDSKNLNNQLQKELFELYPEYKNKLH